MITRKMTQAEKDNLAVCTECKHRKETSEDVGDIRESCLNEIFYCDVQSPKIYNCSTGMVTIEYKDGLCSNVNKDGSCRHFEKKGKVVVSSGEFGWHD